MQLLTNQRRYGDCLHERFCMNYEKGVDLGLGVAMQSDFAKGSFEVTRWALFHPEGHGRVLLHRRRSAGKLRIVCGTKAEATITSTCTQVLNCMVAMLIRASTQLPV